MKPTKTRKETLADVAARSSEDFGAAKRFESPVRRVLKTPKPSRESGDRPTGRDGLAKVRKSQPCRR
jgi:hypothetical protein